MTNIQDLAPEMSHWPNSVQGMKFKYKVHRATLLSHSSILRFSCCNIALFFFLTFWRSQKGTLLTPQPPWVQCGTWGCRKGSGLLCLSLMPTFGDLKHDENLQESPTLVPWEPAGATVGGEGGRSRVSSALSPLGLPFPLLCWHQQGWPEESPRCLKVQGGGFSRQLRNPWLEPVPRKPFPKQDSKLSLTISFQSLTLTHSPALAPRCRRHKECHCGPPVLFHCCTATETASLLPACVYSCCSMRPQCWAWHRPLSQLNPEMWKTYYAQRKMWLWGWCYHHLARIL